MDFARSFENGVRGFRVLLRRSPPEPLLLGRHPSHGVLFAGPVQSGYLRPVCLRIRLRAVRLLQKLDQLVVRLQEAVAGAARAASEQARRGTDAPRTDTTSFHEYCNARIRNTSGLPRCPMKAPPAPMTGDDAASGPGSTLGVARQLACP